jgi:hypothetical protein
MLRALLLGLLAANLLFFAWAQGWLGEHRSGEPQRLANQLRPEWVQVVPWQAASAPAQPASATAEVPAGAEAGASQAAADTACLESGPWADEQLPAALAALQATNLAEGSWSVEADGLGGRWLRVPAADAALAQQLQAAAGPAPDRGFKPCRVP